MSANVRLTRNFERNLDELAVFQLEHAPDSNLEDLLRLLEETVVPNLERFPRMGRALLERRVGSVEAANKVSIIATHKALHGTDTELREYLMPQHLVLYAVSGNDVQLLSIRHHRQLSFDVQMMWAAE